MSVPEGKVGLMANFSFGAYKGGDCLVGEYIDGVYYVDGVVVTYGKEIVRLTEVDLGYFN